VALRMRHGFLLAAAAAPLHTRAATMARLPLRVDVDFVSDTM